MLNEVFDDEEFQSGLANFLSRPNSDRSLPPSAHPRYVNTLLSGILQNVGRTADVPRFTKRVRNAGWHRSPLWLLIRVAIQMSVHRSLGRTSYKRFMLFFMCTLARDESHATLSSNLLRLMSSTVLRRSSKLDSSTPHWLSELALGTSIHLREMLDARWKQRDARPSSFRNPSQDELTRDTQLSLLHNREYIQSLLTNPDCNAVSTPFHPRRRCYGTIEDFLSLDGSFFGEEYKIDPVFTMYNVERLVEQGISDWLVHVTNVDEACTQLEILMDKYLKIALEMVDKTDNLEDRSNRLLTAIELFVALDKLVLKEIPILADYLPGIPIRFLETLLLRKATTLHRLSCAYQYLYARYSRAHPGWSLLSNEFTEDSFPVRYYNQSPHLQQLKARIEQEYQQHLPGQRVAESPLPALPIHAKVVVFELQCPGCVRIWRSAVACILRCFMPLGGNKIRENKLLAHMPTLQPYFVQRQGPPLHVQIHFAYYFHSKSESHPVLRYAVLVDRSIRGSSDMDYHLAMWQPRRYKGPYYAWDPHYMYESDMRYPYSM